MGATDRGVNVRVVTDSGSLRVRRHRRHHRGDHSLCLPGRCDEVAAAQPDEVASIDALVAELLVADDQADEPDRVDRLLARRDARRHAIG